MKKFPFFEQLDSRDCGPACIKMISEFYGKKFSFNTLRDLSYIGKEGVSLLGISEAAEQLGFKTFGGKFSIQNILKVAPFPCILHWNQTHFVVLYGVKKKNILHKEITFLVADPSCGIIAYSEEELLKHWISTSINGEEKGIALLLEPTNDFFQKVDEKEKVNNWKFAYRYIFQYKKYFVQLLLGLLLGSLMQLIFPFLTQAIVDIGISNKQISFIYLVLLAQMILFLSRMSVDFIRKWILLHISTRINISLVSDFLIKLMKLPMSFFDVKHLGDIMQRIEDHSRIEKFLTSQALNAVFSSFNLVIFGIVLWFYSIKIFGIFIVGSLCYTAWILLFLIKRKQIDYKLFEQRSKNQNKTVQLIYGMQEIKLQNIEKRKRWEWENIQAELFSTNIKALQL